MNKDIQDWVKKVNPIPKTSWINSWRLWPKNVVSCQLSLQPGRTGLENFGGTCWGQTTNNRKTLIFSLYLVLYSDWEGLKMNITNDIKPVSYLKSKAAALLNQVNETHRPVIITQNGLPRAVLQDPESYENMRNAIGLLKLISQGESDVRNGNLRTQEDVFKDLEDSLREKL
jgi:prevent-host-death family protein